MIKYSDLNLGGMRTVWIDGSHEATVKVSLVKASTGTRQVMFELTDTNNGATLATRIAYMRADGSFMDVTSGLLTDRFRAFVEIPAELRLSSENQIKKIVAALRKEEELSIKVHTVRTVDEMGNSSIRFTKWETPTSDSDAIEAADNIMGEKENHSYT